MDTDRYLGIYVGFCRHCDGVIAAAAATRADDGKDAADFMRACVERRERVEFIEDHDKYLALPWHTPSKCKQ